MNLRALEAVMALSKLGYCVNQQYSDGVINMVKHLEGLDEDVMIFISNEGEIHPPRTDATMIAEAELHEAKIRIVSKYDQAER